MKPPPRYLVVFHAFRRRFPTAEQQNPVLFQFALMLGVMDAMLYVFRALDLAR